MILLASRSPQRRALLRAAGVEHRVVVSRYDEVDLPGLTPAQVVLAHATGKARELVDRVGVPVSGAVLGADTVVVLDGDVLGKPSDAEHARAMLKRLSGRTHTVLTGVCIIGARGEESFVERADVRFRALTDELVDAHLGGGEWRDRAGGYAVQGGAGAFVESIDGDRDNVIGLPVTAVLARLAAMAVPITRRTAHSCRDK